MKLWKAAKILGLFRGTILVTDFITFPIATEKGLELMWKSFVTAALYLLSYNHSDLDIYVFDIYELMGNKCLYVFLGFVRPSLNIILITMVTNESWWENNFQVQIKISWTRVEWDLIWSRPVIFKCINKYELLGSFVFIC